MSSEATTVPEWHSLRTSKTQKVEDLLRQHFDETDAYRYNSASIRVRVVDARFKGMSREQRDDLVEPILSQLDEETNADIMNRVLLYPNEIHDSFSAWIHNTEFEHPSQSML